MSLIESAERDEDDAAAGETDAWISRDRGRLPAETSERGGAAERQPGPEQRGREQPRPCDDARASHQEPL